jgi:hypothetical protein
MIKATGVILSGAKDLSREVIRFAKDPSGVALRMTKPGVALRMT